MTQIESLRILSLWPQRMRHDRAFDMAALVDGGFATRSEDDGQRALYTITQDGRDALAGTDTGGRR